LRKVQGLELTAENATTVENIQLCAHACHIPLAEFIAEIEKFELHLSPKHKHQLPILGHIIWNGRNIQWTTVLETQLAKLKARIGPQLELISILLQIAAAKDLSGLQSDARESVQLGRRISSHLQRLETAVQQRHARLEGELASRNTHDVVDNRLQNMECLLQKLLDHTAAGKPLQVKTRHKALGDCGSILHTPNPRISENGTVARRSEASLIAARRAISNLLLAIFCLMPTLQRLWQTFYTIARSPALLLDHNIRAEDALGRVLDLPYAHFKFWPVFEARVRYEFRGTPGEAR
jgi:hypothetical protein